MEWILLLLLFFGLTGNFVNNNYAAEGATGLEQSLVQTDLEESLNKSWIISTGGVSRITGNEYSLSHYKVPLYTPSYDYSCFGLIISRLFIFVQSKLTIYFHIHC